MGRICTGCGRDLDKLAKAQRKNDSNGNPMCKKCYNKQYSLRRKLQQSQTDLEESLTEENVQELCLQQEDKTSTQDCRTTGFPAICKTSESGSSEGSSPTPRQYSTRSQKDSTPDDFKNIQLQDNIYKNNFDTMKQCGLAICRTCLQESNDMHSLYKVIEISQRNAELSLFLKELTNLVCLIDDGLPIFICQDCVQNITNAISFKDMCMRSNYILRGNSTGNIEQTLVDGAQQVSESKIVLGSAIIADDRINPKKITVKEEKTVKDHDITNTVVQFTINDIATEDPAPGSSKGILHELLRPESKIDPLKATIKNENLCYGCKCNLEKLPRKNWSKHSSGNSYCSKCYKKFFYHKSRSSNRKYTCDVCGKILTQSGSLKIHLLTHSKEKPFECSLCGKLFKAKVFIRTHMNTNHLPCAKHKCNICSKEYQSLSTLKAHIKGHDMPFLCTICGKKFAQSSTLARHLQTHSKERIYKCDFCDKSYSVKTYMLRHRMTHIFEKRFECHVCGKKFHQKERLNGHAIIHTKLRPFTCTFCGKSFNKRAIRNRHMLLHTGEKKYKCPICPIGYIQHQDFKRHMMKHKENGEIVEESPEVPEVETY